MPEPRNIVIVTPDVRFGIAAKEALENANYSVSTFSSGFTAVDFARQKPMDVALIDFRIQDMPGTDMIDHMRTMHAGLVVIAAPDHPAVHKLNARYKMFRIINLDLKMPELIDLIDSALNRAAQNEANQSLRVPVDHQPLSSPPLLEFWLVENEAGDTVIREAINYAEQSTISDDSTQSTSIPDETGLTATARFRLLREEEPPPPTFGEGGTISELRQRLTSVPDMQATLARKIVTDTGDDEQKDDESGAGSTPAAVFLATALDESTPIERFTVNEFMDQVRQRGAEGVQPLPSWRKEDDKYVSEPQFLSELPAAKEIDQLLEYTATITAPMHPINVDPSDWPTDPLEPVQRSRPRDVKPQPPAAPLDDDEAARHILEIAPAKPPTLPELPPITMQDSMPFKVVEDRDPQLAQLATTLIQISLNVTADATVLAQEDNIIAYAGRVPPDDIDALREQLTIRWDQSETTDRSRIVFATVPQSGEEYMISTRATESGFTLSLIFRGVRPLTEIRRQSKMLVEALESVPISPLELPSEADISDIDSRIAVPSTQEVGVRQPLAFLWLLRDSEGEIDNATQRRLLKTFDMHLTAKGWKIHDLHAPDYIYLYADVPQSNEPRAALEELMALAASVIAGEASPSAQTLWEDSYLILQPGREMDTDEIQRFINFARQ